MRNPVHKIIRGHRNMLQNSPCDMKFRAPPNPAQFTRHHKELARKYIASHIESATPLSLSKIVGPGPSANSLLKKYKTGKDEYFQFLSNNMQVELEDLAF
jgi:hypothetical protein